VIGSQPASRLGQPGTLTLDGALGSVEIAIDGAPTAWVTAINRLAERTGIEAVLTERATLLDDGTPVDPEGSGYLLLRTRQRGSRARLSVRFAGPTYATGFDVTAATATGTD
jgi:hypothetical protein